MKKKIVVALICTLLAGSPIFYTIIGYADMIHDNNPLYGGTLRIGYKTDPRSFNGFFNYWLESSNLQSQCLNKLMSYNEDFEFVPDLAKSYDASTDGKVHTFCLYENILWHDGVKFTSADVKWHYETLKEQVSPTAPFLEDLESIETPDNYTIIFTFSEFNLGLCFGAISVCGDQFILPKHIYEDTNLEDNPANWMPIGTGPFRVTEYEADQHIVMEAFDDYFRGRPFLDKLIFTYYASNEAALMALEAGEISYIHNILSLPLAEIPRIRDDPGYGIMAQPYQTTYRLTFNFRDEAVAKYPWLADKRIRRGIAEAINREAIVEHVYYGSTQAAYSTLPEASMPSWYNPTVDYPKYDPGDAEKLFDAAGYPRKTDGWRFDVTFPVYSTTSEEAELVQADLKEVGINANIELVDPMTFWSLYEKGENGLQDIPFSLNSMGVGPDPDKCYRWMSGKMVGIVGMNMGWYNNSRVTELLDIQHSTTDVATRKECFDEIQEIAADEVPYAYLWAKSTSAAWNAEFKGLEDIVSGLTYHVSFWKVWWTKGTNVTVERVPEEVMPTWGMPVLIALVIIVVAELAVIVAKLRK